MDHLSSSLFLHLGRLPSELYPDAWDTCRQINHSAPSALVNSDSEHNSGERLSIDDTQIAFLPKLEEADRSAVDLCGRLARWQAILDNIIQHPTEYKYRRLRTSAASFLLLAPASGPSASASATSAEAEQRRGDACALLSQWLGFFPSAEDFTVMELPHLPSPQEQHAQRLRIEQALVAVLDRLDACQQQRAELADAVQAIKLVHDRRAGEAASEAERQRMRILPRAAATPADDAASIADAVFSRLRDFATQVARPGFDVQRVADASANFVSALIAATTTKDEVRQSPDNMSPGVVTIPAASSDVAAEGLRYLVDQLVKAQAVRRVDGASETAAGNVEVCGAASSAVLTHLGDRLAAWRQELWLAESGTGSKQTRERMKREHRAAARAGSGVTLSAAEQQRGIVAALVIADIAALLDERWRLEGAIGYRAPHRLEARRLHAGFGAGTITLAELHAQRDEAAAEVARIKEERAKGSSTGTAIPVALDED